MAAYDIKQHFQGLRVETGRRKGRRDPFASGFSDDDGEEETKKTRGRNRSNSEKLKPAPPVQRPVAPRPAAKTSILDQLRDSDDDELLNAPTKRNDRRPSPAPTQLAILRASDRAGRRGSIDKGLQPSNNRTARGAAVLAAGDLAYLDESEDEGWLSSPKRTDRRPSPAPRKESDTLDPVERSHTPKGSREAPKEQSQTRTQPSRHTVASPFAGTKYLEDSESSGDEAISSRQGSADNSATSPSELDSLSPYESALSSKHPEVKRVDKPKQNVSGMSWRAFSTSRTEQKTAEIEALQASLKQRGKSISFGTHAITDDGKRVPIPVAPARQSSVGSALGRGRGGARGKSPPRRAGDVEPTPDELDEGDREGIYDPREYKTNPFTGLPIKRTISNPERDTDVKQPSSITDSLPDIRIDDVAHTRDREGVSAEPATEPKPDDEGQAIGMDNEYIIGRLVNQGGFGVIKELHTITDSGGRVARAVKIVRKTISDKNAGENEKAQQELEHEVSVWRHLDHRHILRLHEVFDTEFATYCVMDLNVGGTLFDVVRKSRTSAGENGGRKGLPPTLAKSYAHQLACALRYLHEDIRVCHRDVKLENCLIDMSGTNAGAEGGILRLCDFGLADFLNSDSSIDDILADGLGNMPPASEASNLTSSSVIGTLEYASPRGLSVNRKLFETAGDVWAFGVIVYALCTGELPFRHPMPSKTVELILRADWDDNALKQAAAGSDAVIELVKGCLEKDIDLRLTVGQALKNAWFQDCREYGQEGMHSGWR